ncbi:PQQ-dependent sugar dehydrogenase [bacterium]|nr:PQQ-dependent sugar dehydrogenase [bacterium]
MLPIYAISLGLPLLLSTFSLQAARSPFGEFVSGNLPRTAPLFSEVSLEEAFPGLTISNPIDLDKTPDHLHWLITTKQGAIYSLDVGQPASTTRPFLNLTNTTASQLEGGLYSLVLHPQFGDSGSTNSRFFFVYYQYSPSNPGHVDAYYTSEVRHRLSRFQVKDNSFEADPTSETILMDQVDRGIFHNGGAMLFHPTDGFLYFSVGDEGVSIGDNNQIIDNNLFGGIMRIDVDSDPSRSHPIRRQPSNGTTANYGIPNTNPFLDPSGGNLEEFYALGLRAPHTMVLDPLTGDIWCGEVGGLLYEEINLIERGMNYGWAVREGPGQTFSPVPPIATGTLQDPYYAYDRASGPTGEVGDRTIICGPIYRGPNLQKTLGGKLIFGDNSSGRIWSLTLSSESSGRVATLLAQLGSVGQNGLSRIVSDPTGDVYCLQLGSPGQIWRFTEAATQTSTIPPQLSGTGIFSDLQDLTPTAGIIPYEVNLPFWSDRAHKRRWMGIPNDGPPYTASEKATARQIDAWSFPVGSVFVKHFDLAITNQMGAAIRKLETRILAIDEEQTLFGLTYKWRDDQSDADLVSSGINQPIEIQPGVFQNWYYPGPSDCRTCHNPIAGYLLGLQTHQLNLSTDLNGGGLSNQIEAWETEELCQFLSNRGDSDDWSKVCKLDDPTANLTKKIRSYLAVNCAFCHRPGGSGPGFDARFSTPIAFQGLVDTLSGSYHMTRKSKTISPGAQSESELLARIKADGSIKMPPVGRNLVDHQAVNLLEAWIESLYPATNTHGFVAYYYNGSDLTDAVGIRVEQEIDHIWNSSGPLPGIGTDDFSARWSGNFNPPVSGNYTLTGASDDGLRVYMDGQLLINTWSPHSLQEESITLSLQEGEEYKFKIEYFEQGGDAICTVKCQLNGIGENLLVADHVSANLNLANVRTRPVVGLSETDNSQLLLQLHSEGQPVSLQSSLDFQNWIPVPFTGPSNQVLLDATGHKFFRIVSP